MMKLWVLVRVIGVVRRNGQQDHMQCMPASPTIDVVWMPGQDDSSYKKPASVIARVFDQTALNSSSVFPICLAKPQYSLSLAEELWPEKLQSENPACRIFLSFALLIVWFDV